MNKGTKAKQISEANEQKLPVGTVAATETALPAKPARSLQPAVATDRTTTFGTTDFASIARFRTQTRLPRFSTLPLTSLTRALDRVEDLITTQTLRLRQFGRGIPAGDLNPGAGLRISLDVRQQANGIEVTASLQHAGDFQFLSRHWSDLQQQLEAHGIRLGPFTSETLRIAAGADDFQQRPSAKPTEELAPVMKSRGLTLEGVVAVANAPRAAGKANRWESWA